jgi:hypothetical protein
MLLVTVAVAASGGCQGSNGIFGTSGKEGGSVSAVQHPTLEGVPLPSGFRLVDERSFGVSTGGSRVGRFEFRGDMDRSRVATFFKQNMPGGGWNLQKEDFDHGIYELRFQSDAEECTIRLKSEGRRTMIGVQVGPIPGGSLAGDVIAPAPVGSQR